MDLDNRTTVITGGASGIGLATACAFARRGATVVLVDLADADLDGAASTVRAAGAARVGTRVCDVTDYEAMQALAQGIRDEFGAIDLIFNNAGIAVGGPVTEMTHDDWKWTIDVDLWGPIHGVEAFLPHIIEGGRDGHVLFTSSFAGLVPNYGLGAYCVAKYGVVALAEVLQREMREHDIGVSVLCPMRVSTSIGDNSARQRAERRGEPTPSPVLPSQQGTSDQLAGGVLDADAVGELVAVAVENNKLYILPHEESREPVRRRFARIDAAFEAN